MNVRDLMKWGLITTGGLLAPIHGLNPFVSSAYGTIPTGANPSPLFGAQAFSQAMPRFDVLPRLAPTALNPLAQAQSNQTQQAVDPLLGGGTGRSVLRRYRRTSPARPSVIRGVCGRPRKAPRQILLTIPRVASNMNSGINPATPIPLTFHPNMPVQNLNSVWTFNGTVPPKLVLGKYSEPILFRHFNRLPADVTQNNGFGRNTIHPRAQRTPRCGERRLHRRVLLQGQF
jgi:hypothetical protein